MARNINDIVHEFFNSNITRVSDIDTPTAIYIWLGEQGYEQAHTSDRWLAYSKDAGYQYVGDIDIQNKVATGEVFLPVEEPGA